MRGCRMWVPVWSSFVCLGAKLFSCRGVGAFRLAWVSMSLGVFEEGGLNACLGEYGGRRGCGSDVFGCFGWGCGLGRVSVSGCARYRDGHARFEMVTALLEMCGFIFLQLWRCRFLPLLLTPVVHEDEAFYLFLSWC